LIGDIWRARACLWVDSPSKGLSDKPFVCGDLGEMVDRAVNWSGSFDDSLTISLEESNTRLSMSQIAALSRKDDFPIYI
jgi:hypothetical protein